MFSLLTTTILIANTTIQAANMPSVANKDSCAKVGLTVEIKIEPLPTPIQRLVDAKTGFGPIAS